MLNLLKLLKSRTYFGPTGLERRCCSVRRPLGFHETRQHSHNRPLEFDSFEVQTHCVPMMGDCLIYSGFSGDKPVDYAFDSQHEYGLHVERSHLNYQLNCPMNVCPNERKAGQNYQISC